MALMVAPRGAVRAIVSVTPKVAWPYWGHSAILEVVQACSHGGHLLGPAPAKVAGSGLVP